MIEKNEDVPTQGGNIAKFSEISGGDKSTTCHEFTMTKFTGTTGEEFIALQLALDFEDFNGKNADNPDAAAPKDAAAPEEANADSAAAASSEPDAAAVANTLDYGGVPNPSSAVPDKGQEAKKPATDAKKAAGAPTKPSYSPILDEGVTVVGICNKAHKKTQNVIQVLYCKATANAMV